VSYPLARRRPDRPVRLDLDSFARAARLHPDLVRRFVALGLLEATVDAAGQLWFAPAQLATLARMQRLRAGLTVNYAALGLVVDLLDRIAELEAALRSHSGQSVDRGDSVHLGNRGGRSWTPTS
jgi:chaperone modulatory protein CbpM